MISQFLAAWKLERSNCYYSELWTIAFHRVLKFEQLLYASILCFFYLSVLWCIVPLPVRILLWHIFDVSICTELSSIACENNIFDVSACAELSSIASDINPLPTLLDYSIIWAQHNSQWLLDCEHNYCILHCLSVP